MTINDAVDTFHMNANTIRELCKAKLVPNAVKKIIWIIPDDTPIILTVSQIRLILMEIIKGKNNPHYIFNQSLGDDHDTIRAVAWLLQKTGFIALRNADFRSMRDLSEVAQLTDQGMHMLFGAKATKNSFTVNLNPSVNFSLLSIGL